MQGCSCHPQLGCLCGDLTDPPRSAFRENDRGQWAAPSGTSAVLLLSGDAGIKQTIEMMNRLVDEGVKDPYINRRTIQILESRNVPQYDDNAAAYALWGFAFYEVRFVNDPVGPYGAKEAPRPARVTLDVGAGDCDCKAVLLATMLGTIGIETRFVTIASDPSAPEAFSHIYPEALINGEWVCMDAARPDAQYGKSPERYFRKKVWSNGSGISLMGTQHTLNGYGSFPQSMPRAARLRGHHGLGDDATDAAAVISASGAAAANVILASNALPQNIYGTVTTNPGTPGLSTLQQINPLTGLPYAGYSPYATGLPGATTLSPTTVMLLFAFGVFLLARR